MSELCDGGGGCFRREIAVLKEKIFHNRWDGTTSYGHRVCDECGELRLVACFTAELNAGEHYEVWACADCLTYHAEQIRGMKG